MNNNEERYKICIQCLGEYLLRGYGSERAVARITKAIEWSMSISRRWRNEVRISSDQIVYIRLCMKCPYELEHLVLKETYE